MSAEEGGRGEGQRESENRRRSDDVVGAEPDPPLCVLGVGGTNQEHECLYRVGKASGRNAALLTP